MASKKTVIEYPRFQRPYSDCEFAKKNITEVAAELVPNSIILQRVIAPPKGSRHRTTERRITQISAYVAGKMQSDYEHFFFCI